jgi:hypothetical protein
MKHGKPEQPQHKQYDGNGPKHDKLLLLQRTAVRGALQWV